MSVLSLSVVRTTGEIVYAAEQEDEVTLAWRGEYLPGDKLVVRSDTHPVRLVLRLDASLAESHVLMTEDSRLRGHGRRLSARDLKCSHGQPPVCCPQRNRWRDGDVKSRQLAS